jgi:cytochrome c oxidase subunit II
LTTIDSILAGDVGMNAIYLAFIFILAVAITSVGFAFVLWSTRHPQEGSEHALSKYEGHWVVIIIIIFLAFFVSTLAYLPYPYAHTNVHVDQVVDVQGRQFAWCLAAQNTSSYLPLPIANCASGAFQVEAGKNILFNVTSIDVTHDFGVYKCSNSACTDAAILFQVQVMPGFFNSILYQFSTPGIYYIRCLEFCGFGHYIMISQLNVTASAT